MKQLATAIAILGTGCLELVGPVVQPECTTSAECNTGAGEVCDEGVCWGDPPAKQLAMVIGAPADRPWLAAAERTEVEIRADGWMGELTPAAGVALRGRVEVACETCPTGMSIDATIEVRRASRILGGRDYLATVASVAGVASSSTVSDDSFTLVVPPVGPDDPPYELRIVPSDLTPLYPDGPTPAAVVPPLRMTVTPEQLADGVDAVLEASALRAVSGRVVDAVGAGIPGMRVKAVGRTDALQPLERVSTLATTDGNGDFVLLLGVGALDVIDVIAQPPTSSMPTLIARDQFIDATEGLGTLRMPSFPSMVHVTIPLIAADTAGNELPLENTRVQLTATIEDAVKSDVEAVFTVEARVDAGNKIEADLIPGQLGDPRDYVALITPDPDSPAATTEQVIEIGENGGVQAGIELDHRASVTGVVLDYDGAPVEGLTVRAHPTLDFMWSLDEDAADALAERDPGAYVTNAGGGFVVWVDPAIDQYSASYDLECIPAEGALVPRATVEGVPVPMNVQIASGVDVGAVYLPDAALVRGLVVDPTTSEGVAGALVQIYEVDLTASACSVPNAPSDCQPPAKLLAEGRSDGDGQVRLVLGR